MRSRLTSLVISPWTLMAAFVVAVGVPVVLWVGDVYSGPQIWPGLVGNFTASFFAFVIALTWDRRQAEEERQSRAREREAEVERQVTERRAELEQVADTEHDRRVDEVRRRMNSVLAELKNNEEGIFIASTLPDDHSIVLPELLRGAWAANAQPLSVLIADSELVSDLSTFDGQIEELQWRLRYRAETEHPGRLAEIEKMTELLANKMREQVVDLIERAEEEISGPTVQEVNVWRGAWPSVEEVVRDIASKPPYSLGLGLPLNTRRR